MPFAFPTVTDLVDRGTYRYHRPTGSTVVPAWEYAVPPTCIMIDQDTAQIAYHRLRENASLNFNETCIRKNALSFANSITLIDTDVSSLFAGVVSQIPLDQLLNADGMDEIGARVYRHCATGSTVSYSLGVDKSVETGYCEDPASCSEINYLVAKVSFNRVTARETPEGGCVKLPEVSGTASIRVRESVYASGPLNPTSLRNAMVEYSNAFGNAEPASDAILHSVHIFSALFNLLGEI